jgi:hypothetical protein
LIPSPAAKISTFTSRCIFFDRFTTTAGTRSFLFAIYMLSIVRSTTPLALTASSLLLWRSPANCAAKSELSTICKARRSPLTSIHDKVVLITGATAGIGAACAMRFAENGSKIILVGRRLDRLEAVEREILALYPKTKIHTVALSVTDYDAVTTLPNNLPAEFKNVDILVNNAGLALGVSSVDQNSMTDAKQVMDTNVLGTIAMCSAFLPRMGSVAVSHSPITLSILCELNV